MIPRELVFFSLSSRSGMGRFASELVQAAGRIEGAKVILIAPPMEREPANCLRVVLPLAGESRSRTAELIGMAAMSFAGALAVLRNVRTGASFVMVELGSTAPVSVLPALAARAKGAVTVLNLHDFYPHVFRFGRRLRALEKAAYRWCFRRFDQIAAMKETQVARLCDEAGIDPDRIFVIDHGPFAIAGIEPPAAESDPVRLLILGSVRRNKKSLEVVGAVSQLQTAGMNVTLRLAGQPRHQELDYWTACKEGLSRLKGSEVIARYIEEDEMSAVLSGIDAIICPYEGFDSQSGVSILAASNGIPLICTSAANVSGSTTEHYPISAPVSAETIASAITQFVAVPRRDRLARADIERQALATRGLWEAGARAILARTARFDRRHPGTQVGASSTEHYPSIKGSRSGPGTENSSTRGLGE